jgi:hypothetical protein
MAQISKPVLYLGLVATVVAAWVLTSEDAPNSASSTKKKKKPSVTRNATVFLPEDYKASFPVLNEPMKNAFKPLVARKSGSPELAMGDMGIPVAEAGWIYTGMADIDGVPTALLENTRTGDGVFLKQGESWKGVRVQRIAPEEIILVVSNGESRRVKINSPADGMPVGSPQTGFQPVNPPIRGPIGGGMALQPEGGRGSRRNGVADRGAPGMDEGTGVGDEN